REGGAGGEEGGDQLQQVGTEGGPVDDEALDAFAAAFAGAPGEQQQLAVAVEPQWHQRPDTAGVRGGSERGVTSLVQRVGPLPVGVLGDALLRLLAGGYRHRV